MSEPLQHSPGPWKALSLDRMIYDSEYVCVCEIWDDQNRSRSQNARLIAAAPDMLRLLRVLSEMSESGADTKDEWYVWRDAMHESKALIARLDGGE